MQATPPHPTSTAAQERPIADMGDVLRAIAEAVGVAGEFVPLSQVPRRVPVSRTTVLRWEREGLITLYRPSSRRTLVPIRRVIELWHQCATPNESKGEAC